jgi:lysophospholipase L1-like esterase
MEGRRVLCIGDSNSSFRLSYVNVLRVALEPLGVPVIDASIPGCTSQDVVDHFRDQVPVHERDIVLIMIGTNDVRRANDPHGRNITSLDEFDGNLQFLVGRLLLARATPILISIPPIDSATMNRLFFPCDWVARESDIESYNNRIRNCAGDHALPFIDFNAALRGPLAPEILADGLHLRPEAHVLLAGMAFTRMAAL